MFLTSGLADVICYSLFLIGIYVILSVSLNIINGIMGFLSLGHAAFFGIGAYTAMLYLNRFDVTTYSASYWLHFIVGILLAALVAAAFGLFVGVPCLRLAGDYLAIATLAFAEIFKIFLERFKPEIFGGPTGLQIVPDKLHSDVALLVVVIAIIVIVIITRNVKYSATGRAFQAIRENEIAAQTMGMNLSYLKVLAFVLASAMAGVAGALFAYSNWSITPGQFNIMNTIMVLLMVVLGGGGSITGSILGAVILGGAEILINYLPKLVRNPEAHPKIAEFLEKSAENPQIIFALLLIVLIRLRPQGIMGMNEINVFWKRRPKQVEEDAV